MKVVGVAALAAAVLLCAACFRQTIQTGRTPASVVIDRPWTATWLLGLVSPRPIDVTRLCRSGIATVVSEVSVPNGLATIFTLGVYAPRHVTITCATGLASRPRAGERVVRAPGGN